LITNQDISKPNSSTLTELFEISQIKNMVFYSVFFYTHFMTAYFIICANFS